MSIESLGDFLKKMPIGQQALIAAEKKQQQLLADPLVEQLRLKYPDLTESLIKQNLNRMNQYVKEMRTCMQCPGIDRCPNDIRGHYTMISCERTSEYVQLIDRKVTCKKLLAREQEELIRSRVKSFYIDEQALLQGFSSDEILGNDRERAVAVGQVMKYISHTKEHGLSTKGLFLSGSFGTGKTFLMCYLLHELAKEGFSGVIVYMPEFIEDLKSLMHEQGKVKEMIELLKHTDLLVFDDIGAENLNPWARDHVVGAILNYRMNRKPTFYTSNYDLHRMEQHLSFTNREGEDLHKGRRLMERIAPYVDVVHVTGRNKRKS